MNQYRKTQSRPAAFEGDQSDQGIVKDIPQPRKDEDLQSMFADSGRSLGKLMKLGQIASMHRWRKAPAWTVKIAVHMRATKARIQIAAIEPYMPKMLRTMTGNGMLYVAPILPVRVTTTLQMAKPKKTIGIVSRAVKPRDMTLDTVAARGGAS
jgi:hypothetical protein